MWSIMAVKQSRLNYSSKLDSRKNEAGPLISVVIPLYNTPQKYLLKCLESVVSQTYANLDIIIVDDNSTDGSGAIADEFATKDDRVRVIHQAKNIFQYQARNVGTAVARGEWVHYLDCDDWIDVKTYEILLSKLDQDSDAILFGGKAVFESEENRSDDTYSYYENAYDKNNFQGTGQDYLIEEYNHSPAPWIVMFKRILFNDDTKFYLDIINEDEVFMPRLLLRSKKVQSIDNTLIFHMIRAGQVTRKKKSFDNVRSYWVAANELTKEMNLNYSDAVINRIRLLVGSLYDSARQIYSKELDNQEQEKISQLPRSEQVYFEYIISNYSSMYTHIANLQEQKNTLELKLLSYASIKGAAVLTKENLKRKIKHITKKHE